MSQSTAMRPPVEGGIFLPNGNEVLQGQSDEVTCSWEENYRLAANQQLFFEKAQVYMPDSAACILQLAEVDGNVILPTEDVPRGVEENRIITINLDARLCLAGVTWQVIDTILPERVCIVRETRAFWGLQAIFNPQGALASLAVMDEIETEAAARFINTWVFDSGFAERKIKEIICKTEELEAKLAHLQQTGRYIDKDQAGGAGGKPELFGKMRKKLEDNLSRQIERNKFMETRLRLISEGQ